MTKEMGLRDSEVEPLMLIYHLHFPENQFGAFIPVRAPKSFKFKREGETLQKLRGSYGKGIRKQNEKDPGLISSPPLKLDPFPILRG